MQSGQLRKSVILILDLYESELNNCSYSLDYKRYIRGIIKSIRDCRAMTLESETKECLVQQ